MKKFYTHLFVLIVTSFANQSCKREAKDEAAIDALVSDASKFEVPPVNSELYSNEIIDSVLQSGVYQTCTTQTVNVVKRIEDFQTFYTQDNSEIYPGNIVQGIYLKDGRLNSIGEFKRQPLNILIKNATRSKSISVETPTRDNITKAVNSNDYYFYFDPPQFTIVNSVRSYSKTQSLLSLGLNANWVIADIDAKLTVTNEVGKNTVFIMLKQIYYTASIGYPDKPSKFFDKKVSAKDLKNTFSKDNPPAYLNSVSYGRIAIAKITSSYTKDEIIASLNAKFNVISGGITSEQSQILSTCEYSVVAAGGPKIDTWNIDNLSDYFINGDLFSDRSGAVPVAYTANYLVDNSPFLTHVVTEYTKRDCE
jgi:thiol-activated cytolysin